MKPKPNPIFPSRWYYLQLRTIQSLCIMILLLGFIPVLAIGLICGAIWGLGVAQRIVFDSIGRILELK